MGWAPRFDLASFDPGGLSQHARHDVVNTLLEALIKVDRLYLEFHRDTPLLYASGVRFDREPIAPDTNWWRDIPATLALGVGHCVALTAWRIAELRERGEKISVRVDEWPWPDGRTEFHVFLQRTVNGKPVDEDPARRLGMP